MTSCERIRADAAGLAALPAGDTERREAFSCTGVLRLRARARRGRAFAAGAVAGVPALQLTCLAHTSLPHLLVFHVGGVLLATAVAGSAWELIRRTSKA